MTEYVCTITWHTIWFDQYKAVYCKLDKPMDHRQARRWHLVNRVHINIVNIYGHTMYIQEIYCFQSQHFSQFTTNLNRTLSVPVTMITWATINLVTLAFVSAKFHHSDAGVCWLGFPQFLPFYQPSQHIVEQSVHALPRGGGSLIVSIKPA